MSSQPPAQERARHQVSQPYRHALPRPPSPTRPESPTLIGSYSEGSLTTGNHVPLGPGEELTNRRQVTSIDTLPDDVLLEIFNSHVYYDHDFFGEKRERAWQTLVHVCRRWRYIVFGSPRYLDLRLVCGARTPVRDMLDVWPAFPLIILSYDNNPTSLDDIIAALKCTDRVCRIHIITDSLDLEIFRAMQQPLPELTHLDLRSDKTMAVLPDSFLGGSAPHLQSLELCHISFPDLPNLLLSATHLAILHLSDIPHFAYISPYVMVTALSALTNLEVLSLGFESPRSRPNPASGRPPPSTRSVLPILTIFSFKGVSEYLDDLVAYIDAPRVNQLFITFFNDMVFDTPQLVRFISHTTMSKALKNAYITLDDRGARVSFSSQTFYTGELAVEIFCRGLDWQISSLEQVCTCCLPPLSILEDLYYEAWYSNSDRKSNVENRQWLELFHPFTAVKNLYLSEEFASHIAPALQELVEGRTTGVLPALQNIFLKGLDLSGSVQESIGQLVAARQVANHPIGISPWTKL